MVHIVRSSGDWSVFPMVWSIKRRLARFGLLLAATFLAVGCFQPAPATGEPQLLDTLPSGWTPMSLGRGGLFSRATIWQPINIDDDLPTEYLLFFTYDNGQVGAAIYDQQTGATGVVNATPVPAPNQPAGTFIPYRVEPSFWSGSGSVGFIAPPGTTAPEITVNQVARPAPTASPTPAAEAPGEATPTAVPTLTGDNSSGNNELVILGGESVLSVVWWRNTFNGYGIAQVSAEAGLEPRYVNDDATGAVESVIAREPIRRVPLLRSYLCRELLYKREATGEPPGIVGAVYQTSFQFVQEERGIAFCAEAPAFPFYPEGVVMAYLRPADADGTNQDADTVAAYRNQFVASTVDQATRDGFLALVDFDGPDNRTVPPVRVEDLETPASIPLTRDYRSPAGGPLTTSVCAQIGSTDGTQMRRLLFQMEYVPPNQATAEGQTTVIGDRFYIGNITVVTEVGINCLAVISPSVIQGAATP